MESVAPDLIAKLAAQGTGWILFLLSSLVAGWLFRQLVRVWEARMEESKTVALALRGAAEASTAVGESVKEVGAMLTTLSALTTQLSSDYGRNNIEWRDRVAKIENSIQSIRDEQIRRAVGSSPQGDSGRG